MKNRLLILLTFVSLLFISCDKDVIKYAAKVRIPIEPGKINANTSAARYAFSYDDVDTFSIYITGVDRYGDNVSYACGDKEFYYLRESDEVVVNIRNAGTYTVDIKAYNPKANYYIASGISNEFTVLEGDDKTIRVTMNYVKTESKPYYTIFRLTGADIVDYKNATIFINYSDDKNSLIDNVEYYVKQLKKLAKTKDCFWWELWQTEEVSSKLDFNFVKLILSDYSDKKTQEPFLANNDDYYSLMHGRNKDFCVRDYDYLPEGEQSYFYFEDCQDSFDNFCMLTDVSEYFWKGDLRYCSVSYIYIETADGNKLAKEEIVNTNGTALNCCFSAAQQNRSTRKYIGDYLGVDWNDIWDKDQSLLYATDLSHTANLIDVSFVDKIEESGGGLIIEW